jgi:hypothetical protein
MIKDLFRKAASSKLATRLLGLWILAFSAMTFLLFVAVLEFSKSTLLSNAKYMAQEKLEGTAWKVRSSLLQGFLSEDNISPEGFPTVPKSVGLVRSPKKNEIFLWKKGKEVFFARETEEGLDSRVSNLTEIAELKNLANESASTYTLLTSWGDTLWSNRLSEDSKQTEKEMAKIFRSGLLQVTKMSLNEPSFIKQLFSSQPYLEIIQAIPDSNIVLYQRTPLAWILHPVLLFLAKTLSVTLVILSVVSFVSWLAVGNFFRPIETITKWSEAVVKTSVAGPVPRIPAWALTAETQTLCEYMASSAKETQKTRFWLLQWQKSFLNLSQAGIAILNAKTPEESVAIHESYAKEIEQMDPSLKERALLLLQNLVQQQQAFWEQQEAMAKQIHQQEEHEELRAQIGQVEHELSERSAEEGDPDATFRVD